MLRGGRDAAVYVEAPGTFRLDGVQRFSFLRVEDAHFEILAILYADYQMLAEAMRQQLGQGFRVVSVHFLAKGPLPGLAVVAVDMESLARVYADSICPIPIQNS